MKLFHEMHDKKICPNVGTHSAVHLLMVSARQGGQCSALIDGFSKAGRLEEAKKLFHEKLDENICPHVVTYS